jgi:N-acyl-D-aspartate/D-glutamate deacylase
MFDVLIRDGTIYEGEGNDPVEGDLGIVGDRISAIGHLASASARQTLEAGGAAVAPGFIDFHSHADLAILNAPTLPAKVLQGVTTEVAGNCGFSPAPPTRWPGRSSSEGPEGAGRECPGAARADRTCAL